MATWDNSVSILIGNGDGTFQSQSTYKTPNGENGYVIAADFSGDGNLDLAVASWRGFVSILMGYGDGTFRLGSTYQVSPSWSAAVTAADFNADGKLDLATTNYNDATISLLLGNGDGTFQHPLSYPAIAGAREVTAGDFNADGRLDLAVGNQGQGSISIFLQTGGPGVKLSRTSESFLLRTVGSVSRNQTVQLTNVGSTKLDITGITLTGANSGDFTKQSNCGASLAGGRPALLGSPSHPRRRGIAPLRSRLLTTPPAARTR